MKLADLIEKTGFEILSEGNNDADVINGYTGDLLSDVMANADSDSALITIQAHKNTIAVATLAGVRVIILCNGRTAPDDMKAAAAAENITILRTEKSQFTVSAKISVLIKG